MYAVITGRPAVERTVGVPVFEHFARTPSLSAIFNNAMTAYSGQVIPAILDAFDFGGIATIVDVGGGHGHVLASILQRYPAMRGVLFDVDHVVGGAEPLLAGAGVDDRCRRVSGDFFRTPLPAGDAYLMKHIVHDWNDEAALAILGNIRRAMRAAGDGRLLLFETVVGEGNEPDFGKLLDVEMLVMTSGRERTAEDFRALLDAAGFELSRIVATRSPLSVIEARPR
jgi:O-methyltransferase domain